MDNKTRIGLIALAVLAAATLFYLTGMLPMRLPTAAVPANAQAQQANVVLVNETDWVIDHLYICPAGTGNWGSDHLGVNSLKRGDKLTLKAQSCDVHDLKLVDEQGRDCVVRGVSLCTPGGSWVLAQDAVVGCTH